MDSYSPSENNERGSSDREYALTGSTNGDCSYEDDSFIVDDSNFVEDNENDTRLSKTLFKEDEINKMCIENSQSLYMLLSDFDQPQQEDIINQPSSTLEALNRKLMHVVLRSYPNYNLIQPSVFIRIKDLPATTPIRNLRSAHLGGMVKIPCVVTRRHSQLSVPVVVYQKCYKCSYISGPFQSLSIRCISCQAIGKHQMHFTTRYRETQTLRVQEVPGSVPAGRLPRSLTLISDGDLINSVKPGDMINAIGVYKFSLRNTFVELNNIVHVKNREYSLGSSKKSPIPIERLIRSIAPSISGHHSTKLALLCSIFSIAPPKSERQNIHILLLGDPGTGKSQFLRCLNTLSIRSTLAAGQGASSPGLTATVTRSPLTGEWILEGGALVLSDGGMCLIDEFDKMNEIDRSAIHEAMEQQTVSVSKAGVVATLNARCSIVAAANPIGGNYCVSTGLRKNVNLSDAILSRFDIICVIKDSMGPHDKEVAEQVMRNRLESSETPEDTDIIPSNELCEYILFAQGICPAFSNVNQKRISKLYAELRGEVHGSVQVTPRLANSITRIATSLARMELSSLVEEKHVTGAIKIVLESYINAQKFSVRDALRRKFAKYIGDDLAFYILEELFNECFKLGRNFVVLDDFMLKCKAFGLNFEAVSTSSEFTRKYTMVDSKISLLS